MQIGRKRLATGGDDPYERISSRIVHVCFYSIYADWSIRPSSCTLLPELNTPIKGPIKDL